MSPPEQKSKLLQNIEYFSSRSSVHGLSYIFDRNISLFDRLLWVIICLIAAFFAIFLTYNSYTEWEDNQVITTLKSSAEPVTDLQFPAFTICGAGQHMENVEKVLFHNFKKWEQKQSVKDKKSMEESFEEYLKETFQIHEKGTNILDILNTMISPSDEASGANAVRSNALACASKNERRKRETSIGASTSKKWGRESRPKTN